MELENLKHKIDTRTNKRKNSKEKEKQTLGRVGLSCIELSFLGGGAGGSSSSSSSSTSSSTSLALVASCADDVIDLSGLLGGTALVITVGLRFGTMGGCIFAEDEEEVGKCCHEAGRIVCEGERDERDVDDDDDDMPGRSTVSETLAPPPPDVFTCEIGVRLHLIAQRS